MKIAIIGAGQQGTALSLALAQYKGDASIFVCDKDPAIMDRFRTRIQGEPGAEQIVPANTLQDAVAQADMIFLQTPVSTFETILETINDLQRETPDLIKPGSILIDNGSTKAPAIDVMTRLLPKGMVGVNTHLINGAAGTGPETGNAAMYNQQKVVIIPQGTENNKAAEQTVKNLFREISAVPDDRLPSGQTHDRLYAELSWRHHMVAFSLALAGQDLQNAGNIWRDMTRVADASPEMWVANFTGGKAPLLDSSAIFLEKFDSLLDSLKADDPAPLKHLLEPAHEFAKKTPEQRARETIAGELHDFFEDQGDSTQAAKCDLRNPGTLTGLFNDKAKVDLIKRTVLPTLVAAAETLSAVEMAQNLPEGIAIFDYINPSFKDSVAAMRNDPESLANLIYFMRDELTGPLESFRTEFEAIQHAIQDNDKTFLMERIGDASAIRRTKPKHRTAGEMRESFIPKQP